MEVAGFLDFTVNPDSTIHLRLFERDPSIRVVDFGDCL